MKILNSQQIKATDQYTISHEPIASIDLMERAGRKIFEFLIFDFKDTEAFAVFCGPGNNGGDGLVVARLLEASKKKVEVIIFKGDYTNEFMANFEIIQSLEIPYFIVENVEQIANLYFKPSAVLVDALFGIGISRPLDGIAAELIQKINSFPNIKISIDVPSGMSPDSGFVSTMNNTIKSDLTYTVQLPKFAFMFAENNEFTGNFKCVNIGLPNNFIQSMDTPHVYPDEPLIRTLIKPRKLFGHKGTFGHALIIAGSKGKVGASILSSKAALRTGCGLLTALIPEEAAGAMYTALPEAMVYQRKEDAERNDYAAFDAIGVGPGIGTSEQAGNMVFELLNLYHQPLVIDADGLNCLANNPTWYGFLKSNIVLTPHPGEFDRLTRVHDNGHDRYLSQQHFSKKHQVTIVLKGHHTSITTPSGLTYFNSTGNNGMATAGSGDVLTGIITSLCARGYSTEDAAVLGVYLHGYAGDEAAARVSKTALIASDIVEGIGVFFRKFER